jgi:hypothetical protein
MLRKPSSLPFSETQKRPLNMKWFGGKEGGLQKYSTSHFLPNNWRIGEISLKSSLEL